MSTYNYWEKLTPDAIRARVFEALEQSVDYKKQTILGIPASYLDDKVFFQEETFLKNAPFISTMVQNPNHIGCHTLGTSEPFFKGTQAIEQEVIELCATDILKAPPKTIDGYIASGGTEANIQAIWIYRNYYQQEHHAPSEQIAILCSEDSHHSMDKAANLLGIAIYKIKVHNTDRSIDTTSLEHQLHHAVSQGKKYFIVIANMMTTMYGSVDESDFYTDALQKNNLPFKLHIDGAYGGFYYPFSAEKKTLDFSNEHVSSVTLDAHKMAQAPYGTGIFLARKGLIAYANTKAGYVEGEDYTLIGSRSGANAIAVWMILMTNGTFGWYEKIFILQKRTQWMCDKLSEQNIVFYRHKGANIITIESKYITPDTALKFGLVPDNHAQPKWYKIVLMDHVTLEKLMLLLADINDQKITPSLA